MGSVVPAPRPPSTGSTAVACGIFPDQGSPALTGGFLATGPPGKSWCVLTSYPGTWQLKATKSRYFLFPIRNLGCSLAASFCCRVSGPCQASPGVWSHPKARPGRISSRCTHVPVAGFNPFQVLQGEASGLHRVLARDLSQSLATFGYSSWEPCPFRTCAPRESEGEQARWKSGSFVLFCFHLISLLFRTTALRCEDMWKAVHIQCVQLRAGG